jgi:hypothetical protein
MQENTCKIFQTSFFQERTRKCLRQRDGGTQVNAETGSAEMRVLRSEAGYNLLNQKQECTYIRVGSEFKMLNLIERTEQQNEN